MRHFIFFGLYVYSTKSIRSVITDITMNKYKSIYKDILKIQVKSMQMNFSRVYSRYSCFMFCLVKVNDKNGPITYSLSNIDYEINNYVKMMTGV